MPEGQLDPQSSLGQALPSIPSISWDYLSGFFDGEGSINIEARSGSKTLILTAVISQKNKRLLDIIARFLTANGIRSRINKNIRSVHELKVGRVDELRRLLRNLNLLLKRGQALSALAYLDGKITGNELLRAFDCEYRLGRRRSTPLRAGLDYPLTRKQSLRMAQEIRTAAARGAQKTNKLDRLQKKAALLPAQFDVKDVIGVFRCSGTYARYLIHGMEANGLVSCKLVGTVKGGAKLVCKRG